MRAAARLVAGFLLAACAAANEADVHSHRPAEASEPQVSEAPANGNVWRRILLAAARSKGSLELDLEADGETLLAKGSARKPKATWPKDMHKGPDADADQLTRDDFVRKCMVVTTVSHRRLLPTKAVESICRATDKVMKCRMVLNGRLKQLHKSGRSMKPFCLEAYQWFLNEYGDKCTKQCRKLQCRSTCSWLEAEKDLLKEAQDIGEKMSFVRGKDVEELQAAEQAAVDAKKAALKQSRKLGFAKTYVERAKKEQNEAIEALKWQQKRSDKIAKKVKSLEKTEGKLQGETSKESSVLQDKKFAMDKLALTTTNLAKRAKELKSRLEPLREKVDAGTKEIQKKKKELGGMDQSMDKITRQMKVIETAMKKKMPGVKAQKKTTADAKTALKTAIENGENRDALMVLHDYMKQQELKYYNLQQDVKDLETKNRKLNNVLKQEKSTKDGLTKEMKEVQKETDKIKAKLDSDKKEMEKKKGEAEKSGAALQKSSDEVDKLQGALSKKEDELAKVQRTLGLLRGTNEEEIAKLTKAQQGKAKATAKWEKKVTELKEARAKLKKLQAEAKEVKKAADAKQKAFDKKTGGLREAKAAHKARRRDLFSRMPEVVRTHGLAKK